MCVDQCNQLWNVSNSRPHGMRCAHLQPTDQTYATLPPNTCIWISRGNWHAFWLLIFAGNETRDEWYYKWKETKQTRWRVYYEKIYKPMNVSPQTV
jgi:hypothetical protein